MTISKPPKVRKAAAATQFIERAPDAGAADSRGADRAPLVKPKKETISLGLDPALLARADAAAAKHGVSRAALIAMALSRYLDADE
ncbi:hypothetical protein [Burkholderia glumae]|uniref:hypothetical protein n=1 Tax=Burkholderia glumae TaxID=337 RepID=UPI002036B1B4|nr:hypothetical protein [Burkholderia glumae]MCM2540904.1 hypothetical protein [Burkholderia glumae]